MVKLVCLLRCDKHVEYGKIYEGYMRDMFGTKLWIISDIDGNMARGARAYNMKDFATIAEFRDLRINDILND